MSNTRHKDCNWRIQEVTYPGAHLAVLMDIRDELKQLNNILHCPNFIAIPAKLDAIRKQTNRIPPRKRQKKAT